LSIVTAARSRGGDRSDWSVGLAVIVYPHTWVSLGTSNQQFLRIHWRTGDELMVEIPASSIRNPKDLVVTLNELLKNNGRDDLAKRTVNLESVAREAHRRTLLLLAAQENERREAILEQRRAEQMLSDIIDGGGEEENRPLPTAAAAAGDDTVLDNIPPLSQDLYEHNYKLFYKDAIHDLISIDDQDLRLFFSHLSLGYISSREQVPLQRCASIFAEPRSACKFMLNEERQRFILSMDSQFLGCVELSEQLAYIMGFPSPELKESVEARFSPDMTGGVSSFNIYAPGLIEPVIIGDVTAPLLRMVNIRGLPDEIIEDTYVAIQYQRILVKEISEIFIEIRSAAGALMPFQYGTCTLTLHFRKIPYF
jgi:hypothetical protein